MMIKAIRKLFGWHEVSPSPSDCYVWVSGKPVASTNTLMKKLLAGDQ